MTQKLQEMCAPQVPGDTYAICEIHPDVLRADVQAHPRAGVAA